MSRPSTRAQLKNWCLMQLGHPVTEVNVDEDQVENCIDEAFQYYQEFHVDAVERWYLKHEITEENKTNGWIPISDNIIGVTRIFPISSSLATMNMFDMRYQMRLNDLYTFTSTSYTHYVMTMQHIRTLDMIFAGEQPVRFNRHTDRLYIDMTWEKYNAGEFLVIEGFIIIDPETFRDVYNDRLLKKLATAYIKKQWGTNMKKFKGMKLPGGIEMNGQEIYDEAMNEIKEIETTIRAAHEEPPMFIIG